VKAGDAAALIADHEREAAAVRVLYVHVLNGGGDAGEPHPPERSWRAKTCNETRLLS
jgi:hypothetical protein